MDIGNAISGHEPQRGKWPGRLCTDPVRLKSSVVACLYRRPPSINQRRTNKFIVQTQFASMEEVMFLVEESDEGGYIAKGLGVSIFTQADTIEELRDAVKEAVNCHYDEVKPRLIRLHLVKEEVFAA